jgi:hypothetical protein
MTIAFMLAAAIVVGGATICFAVRSRRSPPHTASLLSAALQDSGNPTRRWHRQIGEVRTIGTLRSVTCACLCECPRSSAFAVKHPVKTYDLLPAHTSAPEGTAAIGRWNAPAAQSDTAIAVCRWK